MSANATNRFPVFQERIRKIRGDRTQTEFAESLGMVRSTVASYESGERVPSALDLKLIAKTCGVSADYLLGFTDAAGPDLTVRDICDKTGLSEKTVKTLIRDCEKRDLKYAPFSHAFIDSLLENSRSSYDLLKTESAVIQAALIRFSEKEESFRGILRFSTEDLSNLYLRKAAEPLQELVARCLNECVERVVEELVREKKAFLECKDRPDGDFQDRAYRKMIEESDEREEKDNG